MIIDGRKIAQKIIERLKRKLAPKNILAAVLVGNNSASESFLKQKAAVAELLGVSFKILRFFKAVSENELKAAIRDLSKDRKVGGIILQLPLPEKFDRDQIISQICEEKDVDALRGGTTVLAPAVGALEVVLRSINFDCRGKSAVVIGRGLLVGKPIADWLNGKIKKLTVFNSSFFDLKILKEADLVISGVGKAGLIKGKDLKRGAVLVDFGYGFKNGKISGDFDFKSCRGKAAFITPTPGGTGPILVAKLFENFYRLVF